MIVDMHNHTYLCNHATGSVLEYAQKAYEIGTRYFGFSDHAPMNFDPDYRMTFEEMTKYEEMVREAQKAFENKLEILFAYEVDFLEGYMDERVLNAKCDYLIGSVHFINKWGFDNPEFIGVYKSVDIDKIYEDYFEAIKLSAKCGKFDILGHIDLIKIFNYRPKKDIRLIAKDALLAIKKADVVVELNSAGYVKPVGELYPCDKILEEMANLNIKITLSSDAHKPENIGLNGEKTMEKVEQFGFSEVAIFKNRDRAMIKLK